MDTRAALVGEVFAIGVEGIIFQSKSNRQECAQYVAKKNERVQMPKSSILLKAVVVTNGSLGSDIGISRADER